jgi:hypothetical protein
MVLMGENHWRNWVWNFAWLSVQYEVVAQKSSFVEQNQLSVERRVQLKRYSEINAYHQRFEQISQMDSLIHRDARLRSMEMGSWGMVARGWSFPWGNV